MTPENLHQQKELLAELYQKLPHLKILPLSKWEEALERGKLVPLEGLPKPAFRIRREFRGQTVGTVITEDLFLPGFPSIPRVFVLKTGVPRYIRGDFFAEEKIEGYNVRLARIGEEIFAFTRRGFVCPFATDRWPDFLPRLPEFFARHPQLAVCCEVAGPENPFVTEWPPYVKEDVDFFVFDLLDLEKKGFVPPEEKYRLLEEFSFHHPEINGPFQPEDLAPLQELLRRYDREGREGVVLKPADPRRGRILKYVTSASNLGDLRVAFPFVGELDANYIVHRLVRLAIGRWELGQPFDEEFYRQLGESLFGEMDDLLERVSRGEAVEEIFRIRLRREEALEKLLAHFRHTQVRIEIRRTERRDGYLFVEFAKIYPRATTFWAGKLQGLAQID
ncbi:MAG: RNA ligase [Thermodesulfobacteria bacterium]|nr:RNA ligase [Thermodesulfobacteriota bacterium]